MPALKRVRKVNSSRVPKIFPRSAVKEVPIEQLGQLENLARRIDATDVGGFEHGRRVRELSGGSWDKATKTLRLGEIRQVFLTFVEELPEEQRLHFMQQFDSIVQRKK